MVNLINFTLEEPLHTPGFFSTCSISKSSKLINGALREPLRSARATAVTVGDANGRAESGERLARPSLVDSRSLPLRARVRSGCSKWRTWQGLKDRNTRKLGIYGMNCLKIDKYIYIYMLSPPPTTP